MNTALQQRIMQGEMTTTEVVNAIVESAYAAHASDVHIDPEAARVRVRMRVDGILHDTLALPKAMHQEMISRIKVLAGLRSDEHASAQDGRFRLSIPESEDIDLRVSITPTYHGENAALRLLTQQSQAFTLASLGFSPAQSATIDRALHRPYGMLLATGPNGSGKTTTLYTLIKMLNAPEVSILTIEDPIEYAVDGINQIQINPSTGLTFASGLRSILRQDPNVVMVGEIRDQETASIATNAALTGHILLSTLHTNDAATAIPRLLDLQVEPFLIASTVNVIVGQRLVRKVCPSCKEHKKITSEDLASLRRVLPLTMVHGTSDFFVGRGCDSCAGSGYQGRMGIYEVLEITEPLRQAIMQRANASDIKELAMQDGMIPMTSDGFQKALSGLTTIEEILRAVHE